MIRENKPCAVSLGYEVNRYKLLAFVRTAALAVLACSLSTFGVGFAPLSAGPPDAHPSAGQDHEESAQTDDL